MRVLIACEHSATVRDAFAAKGCDALSCDLLPCETGGPHYTGPVEDVIAAGWDLLIAHPPCTFMSSSGMHWTARGKRDPQLTEAALSFVAMLMAAPVPRIAIENPIGVISTRIRKPDQIVQPYTFGHNASKATCLWLKGLRPLVATGYVEPRLVCSDCRAVFAYGAKWCPVCTGSNYLPRWANQTNTGQNRLAPSADRWKLRSRTYAGIATAMAEQWTEQ